MSELKPIASQEIWSFPRKAAGLFSMRCWRFTANCESLGLTREWSRFRAEIGMEPSDFDYELHSEEPLESMLLETWPPSPHFALNGGAAGHCEIMRQFIGSAPPSGETLLDHCDPRWLQDHSCDESAEIGIMVPIVPCCGGCRFRVLWFCRRSLDAQCNQQLARTSGVAQFMSPARHSTILAVVLRSESK